MIFQYVMRGNILNQEYNSVRLRFGKNDSVLCGNDVLIWLV
jgi:hypothetical protein